MILDPEGRYAADGPRMVERLAERVLGWQPDASVTRTRDCIQIDHCGEEGIVVLVTPEAVELRLPTIEWTKGSHGPAASSQLCRRIEDAFEIPDDELGAALHACLEARREEFRVCKYCQRRLPREHMFAEDTCQGCASEHLDVVY